MIKNIIFDLGNVLIDFQPEKYLLSTGLDNSEVKFILKEIYQSDEWVELDRGTLTRDEALQKIYSRNPNYKRLLENNSNFMPVLSPIEENTSLLEALKERGYHLYYLTNYHDDLFEKCFEAYNFFHHFEGGVVSAHVKLIKPQPEIYRTLLEKYDLNPTECLFIDDSEQNTIAAESLGISTIHLDNQKELKAKLEKYLS